MKISSDENVRLVAFLLLFTSRKPHIKKALVVQTIDFDCLSLASCIVIALGRAAELVSLKTKEKNEN